ncbi:hypothetical protein SERLA73DRAFT_28424, partial [Serpula lacrymans var. lacrymans S7.3]
AAYCAIIAMWCAVSRRPFNSVMDPHYLAEVELLRPGTILPSPCIVSHDIQAIYAIISSKIK